MWYGRHIDVVSVEVDVLHVPEFVIYTLLSNKVDRIQCTTQTFKGLMKFSIKTLSVIKKDYFDLCVKLNIPVVL